MDSPKIPADFVRDGSTLAIGVSVDPIGRIVCKYIAQDGTRVVLDLTAAIEEIAERKVMDHMKAWHNHQL